MLFKVDGAALLKSLNKPIAGNKEKKAIGQQEPIAFLLDFFAFSLNQPATAFLRRARSASTTVPMPPRAQVEGSGTFTVLPKENGRLG